MPHKHAIVIGGSIAGLLSARILSDHFERVTVLDRDPLSDEALPRRGIPQARHSHGLLGLGCEILFNFFPGFEAELAAEDISLFHAGKDVGWLYPHGWQKAFSENIRFCSAPRDRLESMIRRRVRAIKRVEILAESTVTGLIAARDGRYVRGVKLQNTLLEADLILDATGRGSMAPRWLEEIGAGPTPETIIDAHVGYASRLYTNVSILPNGWQALILRSPKRLAGLLPQGGGHFLLTLMGYADPPPSDEEGFLRFALSVNDCPLIGDALRNATALSPIHTSRSTSSRLRHFERTPRRPLGFLSIGDAACALNPVYAQGMTVAALSASLLGTLLERGSIAQTCSVFPSRLQKVFSFPWQLAMLEDFRHPTTIGHRPWFTGIVQRYVDTLFTLATEDVAVAAQLVKVMQMASPPRSLLAPKLAFRALAHQAVKPANKKTANSR